MKYEWARYETNIDDKIRNTFVWKYVYGLWYGLIDLYFT